MNIKIRWIFHVTLALAMVGATLLVKWQFDDAMQRARAQAAQGSVLLSTPCGPIEYQEAGTGVPLLAVHGSGGGHGQGMVLAGGLASQGARLIAMSRFGYLRTPMSADATAASQADAHVCLLDALGIRQAVVMGYSAGAPSALQMAIRHPDRVSALVLTVPIAYKPPDQASSAAPLPAWVESTVSWLFSSPDFLFWSALHISRNQLIKYVLATPPELLVHASAQELARVNAILDNVLPVSPRAEGLRSDSFVGKNLTPSPLNTLRLPVLVFSARDDRYGTYASAQYTASQIPGAKFIGFAQGGHLLVGHNDEVMEAIVTLLGTLARP
ncbi:MAG: alpha/beta hydrolase [Rhodoferax sp.]|nr:alpha/beta hydrolase [Rhodoferax sp.]